MYSQRIVIACAAALALATPVFADEAMSPSGAGAKTYDFTAQNGSGETGTVTLAPSSDGKATTVTISLKGAPAEAQPAHIHPGSCAKLDPKPLYPLKSVVDGKSTSTVEQPMAKLIAGGMAVNVHKSANDLATYVACADLGGSMKSDSMTKGGAMMKTPAASPSP